MSAPIVLFVYNRPIHTKQTVDTLRQNVLASESDLIIFSDGAKTSLEIEAVTEVRKYISDIHGFNKVKIFENKLNKGLAASIIDGVTQVLREYDSAIILEDDMITSPYFLQFMNQGLELYKDSQEVISIHGYIYPIKEKLPESFFIRGAHCWGWATWKRGWDLFEVDGRKLLEQVIDQGLADEFDYDRAYPFTKMLSDQINGFNNSWAIRWHASAFLKNKLTLYPGKSLVKNIGFDNSGVHSGKTNAYDISLNMENTQLKRIEIRENTEVRKYLSKYFKSTKRSIVSRAYRKLISIFPFKNR